MTSALSPSQVSQFLAHINLPPSYQSMSYTSSPALDLDFLTQIQSHMISVVPYENLSVHYSPAHTVSLDPQTLFTKIVASKRGRGGYCMENSLLLNHVLRALNFPVYTSAVRIRRRKDGVPFGPYTGWVHIVNLVTLSDSSKWMIDVGFGGDGATKPLPLLHDRPQQNLGKQEIRLIRDFIPTQTLKLEELKLWIYQYRNGGPEKDWNSFYAFAETEAFEPDFEVMNWFTGNSPRSPQLESVLVIKFLVKDEEEEEGGEEEGGEGKEGKGRKVVCGKRMLVDGIVKENLGGRTETVRICKTEGERIEVLREDFGIELTEEERGGIVGWRTELKG